MSEALRGPEGGTPPPSVGTLPSGAILSLRPLSERVTERYFAEFADDLDHYGEGARAWCVHDTQWLLAWLFQDAQLDYPIFEPQVQWLARLLKARGYPLARFERHLELLAVEVAASVEGGHELAARVGAARIVAD